MDNPCIPASEQSVGHGAQGQRQNAAASWRPPRQESQAAEPGVLGGYPKSKTCFAFGVPLPTHSLGSACPWVAGEIALLPRLTLPHPRTA